MLCLIYINLNLTYIPITFYFSSKIRYRQVGKAYNTLSVSTVESLESLKKNCSGNGYDSSEAFGTARYLFHVITTKLIKGQIDQIKNHSNLKRISA